MVRLRLPLSFLLAAGLGVACALLAGCSGVRVVEHIPCGDGYEATLSRPWNDADSQRTADILGVSAIVFGACLIQARSGR